MNNTSITKFKWSQKTNSILNKLGIFTVADFEGISLKALTEMEIPEKTIKQIEDICKVHNIETKETGLKIFRVKAISKTRNWTDDKFIDFIAYTPQEATEMMINELTNRRCIDRYYVDEISVVDSTNIIYGVNVTDM